MLAHREERPQVVSSSGSGLFCVLQPSLVDSIVNRVKWKEAECGECIRNYVLCEVACWEVWQGTEIFNWCWALCQKASLLTPPEMDHISGMSGWKWRVVWVRRELNSCTTTIHLQTGYMSRHRFYDTLDYNFVASLNVMFLCIFRNIPTETYFLKHYVIGT